MKAKIYYNKETKKAVLIVETESENYQFEHENINTYLKLNSVHQEEHPKFYLECEAESFFLEIKEEEIRLCHG